jgi:RNA polymerase sigma-70 factor (ECF subfamily)
MAAAQDGDAVAYQQLLAELLPFVRGLVRARLSDDPAAEDVCQEVLMRIHTARHTFRPERPLQPWVRTIARNAVIDWVRKRSRYAARHADVEVMELADDRPPDVSQQLSPGLERALAQLPDAQRQAVHLLKVEGLSVAEAAGRVGISEGALKLRAHRGYQALRDLLGRERL